MMRMKRIRAVSMKGKREIESPTRGVVLINWVQESPEKVQSAPLHWRIGLWNKPPIDIEIDAADGHLKGLQIVLQDEAITAKIPAPISHQVLSGLPDFDVTKWPLTDRYLDEVADVTVAWTSSDDILVLFTPQLPSIATGCKVDASVSLLFDEGKRLVGLRLLGITAEEKAVLRKEVDR